ncbi:pyridoxamine 5'-phosphate oxidase [Novosphingobium fuchskuhlense]|uniref:Pyridoxamine 5'-phosphate oxidase n=1 Tax=Novosphingobium fuchskuhlense TaxID=1117702 RepID=A0A117UWF9_9SPHN|nr:pyridoxamine 5'-phosphate oxidase family protein [Novosphingobium fuchskuhlense]KUR72144.1 pyridoxamine 5'-phosphate oxidase [Novosphingobium fuchskuhlense]
MPDAVDYAFTPSVKAAQIRKGSRPHYAGMIMADRIDARLVAFVAEVRSFYLGTASAPTAGHPCAQPYIQHRGGPKGFLKVLDDRRLAFADYRGNRQYISTGNAAENRKAFLFLMDYANRRRIKLWGELDVIEGDADLEAALAMPGYRGVPEQAMVFTITAWDINCPQHIPQLLPAEEVAEALAVRDARIAALEAQLAAISESGT